MHGTNTSLMVGLGVFVLAALGLFAYILLGGPGQEAQEPAAELPEQATSSPAEEAQGEIVTAKHEFADGVHTIAGSMDLPTPCHQLRTEAATSTAGAQTEVVIDFEVVEPAPDTVCAQVITPTPFSVSVAAPEDAVFSATRNGDGVVLNLVEVPEGEDIETFEYLKG